MNKTGDTLVILTPAFPGSESEDTWVPSQQLFVKKLNQLYPGVKIVVLTFNYPLHTTPYTWHEAMVMPFGGLYKRRAGRVFLWWKVWQALKKINREQAIFGVLSFWCGEAALVGNRFGIKNHIRHLCWISGQDAKPDNRLPRLMRLQPAELVAMSVFLAMKFKESHGIAPLHIIPNAIDPADFPLSTSLRDIDILGVGSFAPLKRVDIFVETVNALRKRFPEIKAVYCGEGVGPGGEKDKVLKLVDQYKLSGVIQFTGEQKHSKVIELMQRAKILIHPSSYEGFSTSCLEALYAGTHVISFCDPGGFLSDHWHIVQSSEEMILKTQNLLEDQQLSHEPVLLHSMVDSVNAIMQLFSPNKS